MDRIRVIIEYVNRRKTKPPEILSEILKIAKELHKNTQNKLLELITPAHLHEVYF